jgi:cholestenol delta-isomerase
LSSKLNSYGITEAFTMNQSNLVQPSHPYYPQGLILSGTTFVENGWGVFELISTFSAGWAMILGTASIVVKRVNPTLGKSDQALVWWFILCE